MVFCLSNISEVMKYIRTQIVCSFASLSKRTKTKVVQILRTTPVQTDALTKKFMHFANKEGIAFLSKNSSYEFDKTSTDYITPRLFIHNEVGFCEMINSLDVMENDIKVVNYSNHVNPFWSFSNKIKLHYENCQSANFAIVWPETITVGKTNGIWLNDRSSTSLPIKDKHLVEWVNLRLDQDVEIGFLEQFTRLKSLTVKAYSTKAKELSLPSLEVLIVKRVKLLAGTVNLRELTLKKVPIDDLMSSFIVKQSRLIKLNVDSIDNACTTTFPISIKALSWFPFFQQNEMQKYAKHLAKNCELLKMRNFLTNVTLKKTEWLDSKKIKKWQLNGITRSQIGDKWLVKIGYEFDPNLPYLNCHAELYEIWTNSVMAIKLLNKKEPVITLHSEFLRKSFKTPVLKNVKELIILFKMSKKQAEFLAMVFPQFTQAKLMVKGRN